MASGLQEVLDNARTTMNLANEQFLKDDISNSIEAIKSRQNSVDRVIRGVLEKSEPLKRQIDAKQKEIKSLHDEISAFDSDIGQYAAKLRLATESYDVASAKQKEFEASMNVTVQSLERYLLQKNSQLHELSESARASEAINEFSKSCLRVFGNYVGDSLTAAICRLNPQPETEVIEFPPERSTYEIRKELWSKMM